MECTCYVKYRCRTLARTRPDNKSYPVYVYSNCCNMVVIEKKGKSNTKVTGKGKKEAYAKQQRDIKLYDRHQMGIRGYQKYAAMHINFRNQISVLYKNVHLCSKKRKREQEYHRELKYRKRYGLKIKTDYYTISSLWYIWI